MAKFLIIRFSSIGDIVLTTPVIRCIKKQLQAEVHFVTKHPYKSLVEHNPYIDKIFVLESGINKTIAVLKHEHYDYVIDLHHNLRTAWMKLRLPGKHFSFDKLNFEKWLLVNLKINKMPALHIVDRYLHTVKTLGVKNDNEGLDYFLPQNFENESVSDTIPYESFKYVAVVIGAQHQTKQLPVNKLISICKQLNRPFVLLGGAADVVPANEIAKEVNQCFNACGKLSLHQSAFVLKHAAYVLTHDTGLMHIAAAFNKRIISVWGSTVPAFGMTPYFGYNRMQGSAFIAEVSDLKCRPCSKIGYNACPKKHFNCMNLIDEKSIIATFK
jgi:ADP-heptose:LPS heptosyltransferase